MARATGFKNKHQVRVACLDRIDLNTPMDETHPRLYSGCDLSVEKDYPFEKTKSGALQCRSMPWQQTYYQKWWALWGCLSVFVALTAKVH